MIHKNRTRNKDRNGIAILELAIILPVFMILFVGLVNATTLMFAKQSLRIACYEGCRVGVVPGADSENVQAQVLEILNARRIQDYTIQMTPANPADLAQGEYFTVRVTATTSSNLPIPWMAIGTGQMESEVAMMAQQ